MTIAEQLDENLRDAMKRRDSATADVLRMLKSRLQERRTAKGFSGEMDDTVVRDVIGAYRKQMQKALEELEPLGEKAAAQVEKLRFEVAYCDRFLPAAVPEEELRALVAERIAALGITDPKQAGRVIGEVMKTHRGRVEAADVKRIAEEILSKQ